MGRQRNNQWAQAGFSPGVRFFLNGNADFIHWVVPLEAYNSRSAPHSVPWKQGTKKKPCKEEFYRQLWKNMTITIVPWPEALSLSLSLFPSERAVMIIMLFNSCWFAGERQYVSCTGFKSIFLDSNKSVHHTFLQYDVHIFGGKLVGLFLDDC